MITKSKYLRCFGILLFCCMSLTSISMYATTPIPPEQAKKEQDKKITITGKVVDETDVPVIGAIVLIKGTTRGVGTDANGEFTLPNIVVGNGISLTVSSLGFLPKEVKVNSDKPLSIVLVENDTQLDEVIVIGYGTEKKKNIAGAVSSISADELSKVPIENVQKAMEGKVAGVQITSANGTPGGSVSILVRGAGTFNAKTMPLYIIDGVQMITGDQSTGIIKSSDVLSSLNPSEIQSIDILKDGASASIYGAQAANGVVIITTKKGHEGQNKVSVSLSGGIQKIAKKLDVLTGAQVAELDLLAHANRYGKNSSDYQDLLSQYQGYGWGSDGFSQAPTYDWYDYLYRTAYVGDAQVSITGGSAKERHYVSAGFNSTDGVLIETGFKRAAFRANLSYDLTKWLTLSTNNSYSVMNQNQQSDVRAANPNRMAFMMHPANSPYDKDGAYVPNLEYGYYLHNVLQMMKLNEYKGRTNKLLSANSLDFKIMKGLDFKSSYNVDLVTVKEHQFIDPRTREGEKTQGLVSDANVNLINFQTEQVLSYNKVFDVKHAVSAIAGVSYRHETSDMNGATGTGVSNPEFHLLGSTAIPTEVLGTFSEWKMAGAFARANYTYDNKYIVNATIRRDGSSRFGENKRWGWFPSVSAAWHINKENFMKDIEFVSELRLRASYGVTGNSEIGNYVARRWYTGQGAYDNQPALKTSSVGNPNLTWEKSHSKNIGLNIGVLDEKLSAEIDFYIKDTKDLLYNRTVPGTTGFTVIPSNMGGVRNTGLEVALHSINLETNNFTWTSSFNISFNKNEITKLQDGLKEIGDYKVGESVSSVLVYNWAGVNQADGRPMYYDKNGYIVYYPLEEDRVHTKANEPKYFGGFTNNFEWKGFELSVLFQFQHGGVSYWNDKLTMLGSDGDQNLLQAKYTSFWKQPGDVTWIPKPSYGGRYPGDPMGIDQEISTLHYEKTDYLKLKSIMLSYNLNKNWVRPLGMSNVQVYASAYNLVTWTNYPGQDPEFTGKDLGSYPQSRSYSLGVKLDF